MFIPLGTLGNVFTTIIDNFDRASIGTTTTTGHKLTQLRQTWTTASSSYATSSAAANTYPLLVVDVEQTDQVSGTFTNRYLGNGPAFWVTDANNWWAAVSNMRTALDRDCSTSCQSCCSTCYQTCYETCYTCYSGFVSGTGCYQYVDGFIEYLGPATSYNCNPYNCNPYSCNCVSCNCVTTCSSYSYYTEIKILQCVSGTVSTYSTDILVNAASYDLANIPNYISVVTRDNQLTVRAFNSSSVLMGSALVKNPSSPIKGNYAGITYAGSDYNPNSAYSYYYNASRPTS